jgi:hypothetical protein
MNSLTGAGSGLSSRPRGISPRGAHETGHEALTSSGFYLPTAGIVRLCFRHRLLPFLVDLRPWLEDRVPSLHPRYRASSLLRTRPPLHHASVLCPQRVFHLRGLPWHQGAGSHVPRKSLPSGSRRLNTGCRLANRSGTRQALSQGNSAPSV